MLYYNRIDISKGIDLAKSSNSKECMICHYCFFNEDSNFKILYAMVLSVNISNIAIITVTNVDYYCIIHNISKSEATNLLKNSVLDDRGNI